VESDHPDLERIRRLAAELAATDPGPGAALAAELAEALAGLSGRVDALWQVISAVVTSAGLGGPAETTRPERSGAELAQADLAQTQLAQTQLAQTQPGQTQPAHSDLTQAVSAQADFARAMASARRTGQRGLRLSIDGTEWVAALSQQAPGQPRLSQQAPGQPPLSQQEPDRQGPDRPSPSQPQLPADTDRAAWSVIERLARESSGQDGAPNGDENPRHDDR
jgi:hypothetical protein